ncbi:MAG: hypothetical protein K6C12_04390 [Oscillospiraceae bacterium]|nr:hypothetical protein [Oscillospiraceae bacterium]
MEKIRNEDLDKVTGGAAQREKYVSAFYCEYCGKTIHLNFVRALDKARAEHNAKFHPQLR